MQYSQFLEVKRENNDELTFDDKPIIGVKLKLLKVNKAHDVEK